MSLICYVGGKWDWLINILILFYILSAPHTDLRCYPSITCYRHCCTCCRWHSPSCSCWSLWHTTCGSAWWSSWEPVLDTFYSAGRSRWLSMWPSIATSSGPGPKTPPAARRWSTQASSVWHTMRHHRDTSVLSESEPQLQLELCLKPKPESPAPSNGAKLIAHFLEMSTKHTHEHINTQRHTQQLPTMHITHTNTYIHIHTDTHFRY